MIIGFRYVFLDNSLSVYNKFQEVHAKVMSQNKWKKSDLNKGTYIYDIRTKGKWWVIEMCHMFADSIVFKQ